jgi:hypothetical protein
MDPEDEKIVALARASRVRTNAAEGACVRDGDGRNLSAIQGAVAMAVSSGADGLEAVAVVTDSGSVPDADLAVVHDVGGPGTPVFRCDPGGEVVESVVTP